jgi:hypothetical protein
VPPATPSTGVLRVGSDPVTTGPVATAHAATAPASTSTDNARLAAWGSGTAAIAVGAAHVVGADVVDPVVDPVSFYAFVPGGGLLVLAGCLALGLLGVVLVSRGYDSGLLRGPVPAVAIAVFAVSMVLIGIFPTDPPGTVVASASAVVHRVSAATAFAVLPLVGLGSLRRRGTADRRLEPLRRTGAVLLVIVVVFLAVHLPLVALGSGIVAFGLLERVGLVLMGGYLALLAFQVDRQLDGERVAVPAG